jgi:CO/xanthine dehydrogenase FAD-binding subunit
MKPPAFDYVVVASTEEATAELAAHGDAAKILAGGQSLMPMLNLRLAAPARLVDLNRVTGLSSIEERDGGIAIGAMTRQRTVIAAPSAAASPTRIHRASYPRSRCVSTLASPCGAQDAPARSAPATSSRAI